jgi:acyl carrier protein
MSKMTREAIFERANKVFRDIFDDDSITVCDETTADDIEDWDSLEHINLILALEEEFGMKFSMGEVTAMKNVGEAVNILLAKATK